MRIRGIALNITILAIALLGVAAVILAFPASAQVPAYKIAGHVPGPDGGWDYVTVDADARRLYAARADAVMALDLDSGKLTPALAPAARGHIALPVPGGRLLVTNGNTDSAVLVDALTGKTLAALPTGKGPDAAAYDPKSGLAFVVAHKSGEITFIDLARPAVVATVPTGGKATEFAAVDGAGRLWVNDEEAGDITVIDIKARKVVAHHKLPGCEGPTGLIYVPTADRLVATCDKVAAVIDPASGAIVDRLAVGEGPDAAIYDPVRKTILVPAGESGTLTVIDASGTRFKVVQSLKTRVGARTGMVDPKTGKVYLPTARTVPNPAGKGRPVAVPGSFELLVLAP